MSASESAFSDAEEELCPGRGLSERKRQRSVEDMFRAAQEKRKRLVSPKQAEKVSESQRAEFLVEVKRQIETSIKEAIDGLADKLDRKFASVENKIEKLESQLFEREQHVDELTKKCSEQDVRIKGLEEQIEEMERHSRSTNLVLWSEQFGARKEGEDIERVTLKIINENFPNNPVSKSDFTCIHRMPKENTVICAFANKALRNAIYAARLDLRKRDGGQRSRLFVSESLTKKKREIFSQLLELKKKGRVWTVFTKNGIPCMKVDGDSPPVRFFTMEQFQARMRGLPPPLALPDDRRGGGGRGGGAAAAGGGSVRQLSGARRAAPAGPSRLRPAGSAPGSCSELAPASAPTAAGSGTPTLASSGGPGGSALPPLAREVPPATPAADASSEV